MDESELFEPRSVEEWRAWLAAHHDRERGVWLVLQKKASRQPGPRYEEALEEALCYGWIDSRLRRLDEERSAQWFSPRKPNSIWSRRNVERVQRLIEQGRMAPAGMAVVEQAKKRGAWDPPQGTAAGFEMPADLEEALCAAQAREAFQSFAPGYQQMYLHWVLAARTQPTRENRIVKVVQYSLEGRKPGAL